MKLAFSALLAVLLVGCGTTGHIKGTFVDAEGRGIPEAHVILWKNPSIFALYALPYRVAEATTDAQGRFEATAGRRVHFITADSYPPSPARRHHGVIYLYWSAPSEIQIKEQSPNQRPEANAGKESISPTAPGPGVAHP